MNTATSTASEAASLTEMGHKLAFTKKLQAVTNKIHATWATSTRSSSKSVRTSAHCSRPSASRSGHQRRQQTIVSKVKTGLAGVQGTQAGHQSAEHCRLCRISQDMLNIADVYDDEELAKISPELRFLKEVDKKTGYRTRQMLVFPIINSDDGSLMGVVQVINSMSGLAFSSMMEEGAPELAGTLAIALNQRKSPIGGVRSKYDLLVSEGIISAAELELAQRSARKSGKDLEDAIDEFQVNRRISANRCPPSLACRCALADRVKPMDLAEEPEAGLCPRQR